MKRNLKFVVVGEKAEWSWELQSPNGLPIAQSYTVFNTRAACLKSIRRIRDEVGLAALWVSGIMAEAGG